MANTKKISINTFDKIMKENYIPTSTIEWDGIQIIIKRTLSFKEMLEFVDSVTNTCFTITENIYMPEAKDFAIKSNILERYANFNLPDSLGHRYELIYCTDAVDTVLREINYQQFNEILKSIDAKIENRAQANIEAINKQMNELYSAFNNLQKQLEEMFSGVKSENFNALLGAFGNGELNEDKIVEAYLSHSKTKTEA